MKILFVYPNSSSQVGFNYGVASLSAELKKHGHEVAFWQLCEDIEPLPDRDAVQAKLEETEPDVIGFSVVTNQWPLTLQVAGWMRELTEAPILCGGIHATVAPEEVLNSGAFDFIFVGECEGALLEFAAALETGDDFTAIRNLGYLRDGDVVINPVRPLPDLTALPQKDYDVFDFQRIIDAKGGWVGLMASRGCPFNCTYCFNHLMVKKYKTDLNCSFKKLNYIRHHSVQQMIDEIRFIETTYKNVTMYIFDDDLFTFDKEFVIEFCNEYKKVSNMPFVVNGHVGLWDDERAAALADAGCRIVKFGVESGSERIRKQIMHRHMTNDRIVEAIDIVHRHGMHSSCFIMFGLPEETEEDIWATVDLMSRATPGRYRWTYFYPFPGTESYELAEKGGFIDFEKFETLINFTDDSCLNFGAEQNLLLKKIGKLLPWFVNARSDLPVADDYRKRVDEVMTMNAEEWAAFEESTRDEDKAMSQRAIDSDQSHYAIKYNRFMGVISDYFLNEE